MIAPDLIGRLLATFRSLGSTSRNNGNWFLRVNSESIIARELDPLSIIAKVRTLSFLAIIVIGITKCLLRVGIGVELPTQKDEIETQF